ncbi:MAG: hypothetical protein GY696_07415, partial [Gammaproteobacteria bacterium]|nr:hypothetical protein [Gammaproteobacteria bacterium]
MEMDEKKVSAILDCPRPKNTTELKHFLGILTFYRRYMEDFGGMSENLHNLLRKGIEWDWTVSHESEFLALKMVVVNAPCLEFPDPDEPYHLSCDASDVAVG